MSNREKCALENVGWDKTSIWLKIQIQDLEFVTMEYESPANVLVMSLYNSKDPLGGHANNIRLETC